MQSGGSTGDSVSEDAMLPPSIAPGPADNRHASVAAGGALLPPFQSGGAAPLPVAPRPAPVEATAETEEDSVFPIEAFIFPDDARRASPGSDGTRGRPSEEVAERLEALARDIRADGSAAIRRRMNSDDTLDSLMATLLAGYLAHEPH